MIKLLAALMIIGSLIFAQSPVLADNLCQVNTCTINNPTCPSGFTCNTTNNTQCPSGYICTTTNGTGNGNGNNGGGEGKAGSPSSSTNPVSSLCEGAGGTYSNGACTGGTKLTVMGVIKAVANVLSMLVGAISVIMIIIGGLRYVISNGNQSDTTAAKNTILYAIVGVVVAIAAYAIVNFVVKAA